MYQPIGEGKSTTYNHTIALARRSYATDCVTRGMDRQQAMALFFAFLMVSSMIAWGISFL